MTEQDLTRRRILVDLAGRAKWILRGLAAAGCTTDDDDLRWALNMEARPSKSVPRLNDVLAEVDRQCESAAWPPLSALVDGSAEQIARIHGWAMAERRCRYCTKIGHVARDCPAFLADFLTDYPD